MITLLSHLFIKNRDDVTNPAVRRAYGQLCGMVGIALNLVLFVGKFFAGTVSGSVAITADAFNNLSDAGSSVVTLLGFRLAGKKPDPEHPFGHGRMEYVSGLIVSRAACTPDQRIMHATTSPTHPSIISPVKRPTSIAASTAVVAMLSEKLSAAVASMATESIFRLMRRLYRHM